MTVDLASAVARRIDATNSMVESEPANAAEDQLYDPIFRVASDVEVRGVSWLWPGRFPLGMLSLLVGHPDRGKSFLLFDAASRVTAGRPWPDGTDPQPAGDCVFIGCEDTPECTIVPRLMAAQADLSRFYFLEAARVFDEEGRPSEAAFDLGRTLPALDRLLSRLPNPRLVIVDPLQAFLAGVDCNANSEVRQSLKPLGNLIATHNVALIGINHCRKSGGSHTSERMIGSTAFGATSRASWEVHLDEANSQQVLCCGKLNIAKPATALAFKIVASGQVDPAGGSIGRVEWCGDVQGDADYFARRETEGGDHEQSSELEAVVVAFLADGPKPVKELNSEAALVGASSKDVWRLRQRICNAPTRKGFGAGGQWIVSLKEGPDPP